MLQIRRSISGLHLLIIGYLLVLAVLVALIALAEGDDETALTLTHAVVERQEDETTMVSFRGDGFRRNAKGLLIDNMVNEESQLWHYLPNMPVHSLDVVGGRAHVACFGNKIVCLKLDSEGRPKPLNSIDLPGRVSHIQVCGGQALVGMAHNDGMALVALADSGEMKLKEHYASTGTIGDMVLDRDVVYYSDLSRGVVRYDFSADNPQPELLAPMASPWRMALSEGKLVVGTIKGRLHLFDVADDSSLTEEGVVDFGMNIRGTDIIDDTLAVALANGSLRLFSLSRWPELTELAVFELPGPPLELKRVPGRPWLVASLVSNGFALVDLSRPENPVLLGHVALPRTLKQISVHSDRVFAVSREGFESFSLDKIVQSDHSEKALSRERYKLLTWNGKFLGYRNKELISFPEVPINSVAAFDKFTAIPDAEGLSLFSMGREDSAMRVGSVPMINGAEDAVWREDRLYVLGPEALYLWHGRSPETLELAAEMHLPGQLRSLELFDSTHLLVSSVDNGLYVIDVEAFDHPRQVAELSAPKRSQPSHSGYDILVRGKFAFVSQGGGGIQVVDLSLPEEPLLLQIIDTPGYATRLAEYDGFLLVADGVKGVYLIDVDDPTACLAVGSLPTPLRVEQLVVAGDSMIVSSHPAGTLKLPVPQRMRNLHVVNSGLAQAKLLVPLAKGQQFAYLYDDEGSAKVAVE